MHTDSLHAITDRTRAFLATIGPTEAARRSGQGESTVRNFMAGADSRISTVAALAKIVPDDFVPPDERAARPPASAPQPGHAA